MNTLIRKTIGFVIIALWVAALSYTLLSNPTFNFPDTITPITTLTVGYIIGAPVIGLIATYSYMIYKQRETL